ncbi:MAG TPA: hypothetical protein VN688_14080 [Gemmataceae bacterium]|nr:hypothetical protein [Gemmataceae bacterium]
MVPRSLLRQLNRLRRRERLLRLTWAVARCLAVFSLVLAVACSIDFVVDLYRDTPRWLHTALLGVQAALWLTGAAYVVRVLARRLPDTQVALWIEEKMPKLGHRLISAVQLNRLGAETQGMSPAMIAAVTQQAEEQAAATDFARIADARRLKWTAQLLAPLGLAIALLLVLCPDMVRALLARQMLDDQPIPRSLAIESANVHQVWPVGEEGVLRFRVTGAFAEHLRGEVRIDTADGENERHELVFESQEERGAATYIARMPPGARDFSYRAWLKDGRTHQPADVHFEPRTVVQRQQAWVQLPGYVGLKPNGQPFEEAQKGADILYRLAGSSARVLIETQKPITKATIEVLGPPHAFAEPIKTGTRAETVRRSVDLAVGEDGRKAEGSFSFQPGIRPELLMTLAVGVGAGCPVSLPWAGFVLVTREDSLQTETAYRIVVRDEFGLENSDRPRRGIRTGPVEAPEVALQPETLSQEASGELTEENEIEGIPLYLGQRVRLDYKCSAVYGLSRARLRYRVIPRTASREDDANEPPEREFLPLPLGAPHGQTKTVNRKASEEFSTWPVDDPDRLGGTEGKGRYDFDSAGIPDGKGGLLKLQEGDRIQFYVEVFGRADPDGVPGRSMVREKEVVNLKDFLAWLNKKEDQQERIRQLEERQRGIAGTVSLLPEERPHVIPQPPPPRERPVAGGEGDAILGRSWQLIGPFPNDKDTGHAKAYPPETDTLDLGKEYDGLKGKMRWQSHNSSTDKIDLQKVFDHGEAGVAYAVCWVKPGWRMRPTLVTGSDDGIKVWINRKLVLDKAVHREAIPSDDKTPVMLEEGWQEVLVKVDNRFGTWAFYLDFLDPSGKPLRGQPLQVRTTPPLKPEAAFVKDWLMLGPFVDKPEKNHAKEFPPEKDAVDLKREYDGRKGKIRWKEYHSKQDRIDLLDACSLRSEDAGGAVAYTVCWIKSDKERLAILATGSDDGIKVWLNRKIVHDKGGYRPAAPNSERTPIRLKAGWNELLVKIDNYSGPWVLYLQLLDPATGSTLSGVEYRIKPPEKKR